MVSPNCMNFLDKNDLFVLINYFFLFYTHTNKKKKNKKKNPFTSTLILELFFFYPLFENKIKISFLMFVDSNQLICLCDTLVLNKGVFVVDN